MILFKLYDIEIKNVQNKPVETSPNQFLATKYQISKHLGLLVLLESFPKREGQVKTCVTLSYLKKLKILYL